MRHGAASSLLADGATPAVVQRQLRHSDARITLGIYGHVVGNQQREAVESRSARIAKYAASCSIVSKQHFVSKKEIKCC